MTRRTLEERKKILKEYIATHPNCTCKQIEKDTKLKVERVYVGLREAYLDANIPLSKSLKKRNLRERQNEVLEFIKNNPKCTVTQIHKQTRTNLFALFGSILHAYQLAGVVYQKKESRDGIRNPLIIKRCREYEHNIFDLLRLMGKVTPHTRTPTGIVDCLFETINHKYVVEVKDFRARNNITQSQIKQLISYMRDLDIKNGLLVCPKESLPKQKNGRNIYIGNFKIMILSDEELRGCSIKEL